jgi:hypothetical protein
MSLSFEQQSANASNPKVSPHDYIELVRKLRWLDMEEEAQELENRLQSLVPVERVRLLPIDTD